MISVKELRGGRTNRRGAIFGAAVRNDRPISQSVLHRLTGVSERSRRRHRETGCFGTIRQDADLTGLFDVDASLSWLTGRGNEHRSKGVYLPGNKVHKRLPNLHCAHRERIPGG